ncbi:ankyrin repeat domain-containing protein 53 [Ctenodactylus gundi]
MCVAPRDGQAQVPTLTKAERTGPRPPRGVRSLRFYLREAPQHESTRPRAAASRFAGRAASQRAGRVGRRSEPAHNATLGEGLEIVFAPVRKQAAGHAWYLQRAAPGAVGRAVAAALAAAAGGRGEPPRRGDRAPRDPARGGGAPGGGGARAGEGPGRLPPVRPAAQPGSPPPGAGSSPAASPRNYSQLFAAAVGNVEWLRFCLSRDRGEVRRDDKGFTAIHFAAQWGQLTCLQVLIEEYKFPVDLPTSDRQTPLHLVIRKHNKTAALPCIHYLLKKGAGVNACTGTGSTPLHQAAREGLLSCVQVLVQSNANVHAQDVTGCKPIDYCKMWNHRACARFLKDAMWKRDKKDFAHEMVKLNQLKDQLALMERNYLIEYQKEHQLLNELDFRKWLHSKLVSNAKQEIGAPTWPIALSRNLGAQISKSFHHSILARLQSMNRPKVPPRPTYWKPKIRRPNLWNLSNNPSTSPTTEINFPQGIRLGVHPDPCQEPDFQGYVKVTKNVKGGTQLHTVDGHWVAPVPQLPVEVVVRVLHPGVRPYRMKVPQGFYVNSILDTPQRRHLNQDTFRTNTMAMTLRDTFDEAFLAAVQAHQELPALPSPQVPT